MNIALVSSQPVSRRENGAAVNTSQNGDAFRRVLHERLAQDHTVRPGESLWNICSERLEARGARPTRQAVHDAVNAVAKANRLSNPDMIRIGQVINMASLSAPADTLASAASAAARDRVSAPVTAPPPPTTPRPPLVRVAPTPQMTQASAASPRTDRAPHPKVSRDSVHLAELVRMVFARKKGSSKAGKPWGGILSKPARLSSDFGYRKDPFTGRRQFHEGIDLAVDKGARIRPIKAGKVTFSGRDGGYGNVVIVRHYDGTESVYGHNARNLARVGERVSTHSVLGLSGSSGRSTGPHLHFEIRVNGKPVDPKPYLKNPASVHVAKAF